MASPSEPSSVSELLDSALSPVLGGPAEVRGLTRLSGGASRETWSFTAQGRQMILRRDPPGRPAPPHTMRNEAAVMLACRRAGLAVPELILHSDDGGLGTDGLVMARVDGETIPRRILRDARFESARLVIARQVAEFLAGLHAIDPAEVPDLAVTDDLATYRVAYDMLGDTSPAFETTFEWLEANRPAQSRRTLVHGDLRMGNVIVDDDGVAAVIDWELLHLGDPVEDLAWFCVKAWRFGSPLGAGGVANIDDFLSIYETASGHEVDRDTFHWWLVEKTLIWGIIAMGQANAYLSGAVRSHELAAIGRRVAEQEWDLVELLAPASADAALVATTEVSMTEMAAATPIPETRRPTSTPESATDPGIYGRPTAVEILAAVRDFLTEEVMTQTGGTMSYRTRVAANMLGIAERQLLAQELPKPAYEYESGRPTWDSIARVVLAKVRVANPQHPGTLSPSAGHARDSLL